jgi:hypothetical protein
VTKASPGTNDANPRIDGHTVVYERGLSPGASIYALDITNDVESAVFTYSGGPQGINHAVSGTRDVYQRNSDIILHDLATGQDIDVEAGPDLASRPDIDGDTVVYEFTTSTGDFDIAIYRVRTGTTTRIQRPGDQRGPHVSGGVVVFDDDTSGFSRSNIGLYHIPTGTMQFIGEADASDRLNDISGHRVVYQSNRDGNNDIYLYEFDVQMPEIDVAPTTHDFGDVNLGASASTIATISNVGALPLTVSSVAFGAGSNAAFTATFPGAVPTIVDPGGTLDVPLMFKPTAPGVVGATLDVFSDDLDEVLVHVALTGRGMTVTPTPLQQISDLLAFFDASVGHGTRFGTGPGNSA